MGARKWPNTIDSIDLKIEEWWKEMWKWIAKVVSWTCNAIWKTLGAWAHLIWAWVSKIQEQLCDDKDVVLKKSRKNITKSHVEKAKIKSKKALKSVWETLWWWRTAVKGTWKVAVHSVRKTVKEM